MFGKNIYEKEILSEFIQKIIQTESNREIVHIHFDYNQKYDFIKNYSLIVGTNDDEGSDFCVGILSKLNQKKFYDTDKNEIFVEHNFSQYKNVLYLSGEIKKQVIVGSSVFIDSNSINMFERFYNTQVLNDFIEFKYNYNIDMNYLPYILEDYVNPHNKSKKTDKTLSKIKIFEIVNNLEYDDFIKTGTISENKILLIKNGYANIDELVEERLFYWTHFIEKNIAQNVQLNDSNTFVSEQKLDINLFLSDYYFIYAFLIKAVIEHSKNIPIEEKIINFYHEMILNGRIFMHLLEFIYDYFSNQSNINQFMNYDNSWTCDRIFLETHNKAWDIFLYYKASQSTITNFGENNSDFNVSFFLTKDRKFYTNYVKGYKNKVYLINESNIERPFVVANEPTERSEAVRKILSSYLDNNQDIQNLKERRWKLCEKYKYSMGQLFKQKMEMEFKNNYCTVKNRS